MKKDRVYLRHIDEAAGHIEGVLGSMERNDFLKSTLVQSAVIRQLEVIGEAVKNLSGALTRKYKEIPGGILPAYATSSFTATLESTSSWSGESQRRTYRNSKTKCPRYWLN